MITKWSDNRITEHFTLKEYTVNQTEDCAIGRKAMLHAAMLEEFRVWLDKPMKVNGWFRTKAYNKKVGGVSNSNHLNGCATDIALNVSEKTFIKYAKKWKSICKKHKVIGEIGYYPVKKFIHFGSQITYTKTFYHWMTDNSGQHNLYFGGKI